MALRLEKQNGHWYVVGTVVGQRVRQSTRLPDSMAYKPIAEKVRLKVESEIVSGRHDSPAKRMTWGEAADGYLEWKHIERKTSRHMSMHVEKMREFWGAVKLADITPAAVQAYVGAEWGHLKPGSVRRYLNTFRAVLSWAKDNVEGYGGVKVPVPTVKDARDVHFDEGEATAFLEWVREHKSFYLPHFLTLVDTGVRLNEMLGLRSPAFSGDVVRLRRRLERSGKTQTRDIPMTNDMAQLAKGFRGRPATEVLYVSATGKPWANANSASAALNLVLKEGCEAIGSPSMRVHDLRHTFAYLTAKAGADLGDLQYLMGHEDISQTMRYRGFIQSRARTFVSRARGDMDVLPADWQESDKDGATGAMESRETVSFTAMVA